MCIQYSDTHFSENMPLSDAMERFAEILAAGTPVQALHVGTDYELTARKNELVRRAELQKQVDELRDRLNSMPIAPASKLLHLPTVEEMKRFSR